jgi:cytochrome P450
VNLLFWKRNTPSHVPQKLVRPINSISALPKKNGCPFQWVTNLRQEGSLIYGFPKIPNRNGSWIPTKPEDIKSIFVNNKDFVCAHTSKFSELAGTKLRFIPFESDGPEHVRYKFYLELILKKATTATFENEIREKAKTMISSIAARTECEFLEECANRFPVHVLLHLLEFPNEQFENILGWQADIAASPNIWRMRRGARKTYSYIKDEIAKASKNGLLSLIRETKFEGTTLSADELASLINALFIAGLHTVTSALYSQTKYLSENPEVQKQLRDDVKLIPGAIEELLRTFGTASTARYAKNAVEISGTKIEPGDHVLLNTAFLNFDDQLFSSPEKVDVFRSPVRHYSFARGQHQCVGKDLARLELKIFMEEWLKAIPQFELREAVSHRLNRRSDLGIHTRVSQLPLTW